MPSRRRRLLEDIPRLLRGREAFRSLSSEAGASVPAFLAWKALLIAAQTSGSGSETEQCRALLREVYPRNSAHLYPPLKAFVRALQLLSKQPLHVVAEWFVVPEERASVPAGALNATASGFVNRLQKLNRQLPNGVGSVDPTALHEVMNFAYLVRNAVIGHGSVLSTGPLFPSIVPAFEVFVGTLALAAWAQINRLEFDAAAAEFPDDGGHAPAAS